MKRILELLCCGEIVYMCLHASLGSCEEELRMSPRDFLLIPQAGRGPLRFVNGSIERDLEIS